MISDNKIKPMLQGVFAPISTPFTQAEELDLEALEHNLEKYEQAGIHGYLVLGSNGENKSLTEEEKYQVLETAVSHKSEDQVIMAGVMYEAQKLAGKFIQTAAQIGADCALIQSPAYFKKSLTDEVLGHYFAGLAAHSPIPLLIYNSPGFTGVELSYELLSELSKMPNIVAMKDSSGKGIFENLPLNRDNFHVMAGSISTLFPSMMQGSIGGTVSLANYLPELAVQLWQYGHDANEQEGQPLHERLTRLNKAVSGAYGVSGVKAAMNLLDFLGGIPRRPLHPLVQSEIDHLKKSFSEAEILLP